MRWTYERLDEEGKVKLLPLNDNDGAITGKIVVGLQAYMDENPDVAHAGGWIKHIHYEDKHDGDGVLPPKERDPQYPEYNRNTQFLMVSTRQVDEWTIEDVYHVRDKSEEMILLQEIQSYQNGIWID